MPVRIAAVADLHVHDANRTESRELLDAIGQQADVLVLAGDLTNHGLPREAEILVEELAIVRMPVVGILGNHDEESGHRGELMEILCRAGVLMLDDEPREVEGVGFAGVKGFCGGFGRHALTSFGEDMIKDFVRETLDETLKLESGLARLRTPSRVAVLHYSPVRETVEGEPLEIFPFLGCSRMAEPLDQFGVTACFHGHAHNGAPEGHTTGGVPVYNVALPLLRRMDPARPFFVLTV